ncbi:hypothetical protein PTTG_04927 [Puccinia triticina 1-1 BBBD Race 1]|uniref:Uncharacterized protein n=1 Tax=Puccinia triticina (isolate 1-1 / race 1 (BBBD)) TaxID=630390 RepID=A0A180GJJ5_PUCT1|nr:hypothetical protein PTTG_04927 [Puccinia triticina 1-1 BBBD Race 1]
MVVIPIHFFTQGGILRARCWEVRFQELEHFTEIIDSQITPRVRIHIPFLPDFHNSRLQSISVDEFDWDYSEITWMGTGFLAEVCAGKLCVGQDSYSFEHIPFPNPWREKAKKMILRNVPITLYSDDTSGNVSKQFNKHISYYFTLSGLPPRISNQEYNCHFLATSNLASACEIAEQIVQEINEMATKGFEVYDHSIGEQVWVTSTVFCFLADSPMHAEITCTPNPGSSLNPCRINLRRLALSSNTSCSVTNLVKRYLLLSRRRNQSWAQTKHRCHKLFETAMSKSFNQFTIKGKKLGLKDPITTRFLTEAKLDEAIKERMKKFYEENSLRLYNPILELIGFDGVLDTPVEVLHVVLLGAVKYLARDLVSGVSDSDRTELIGRLEGFNCSGLNIESFKPKYLIKHIKSLVGRDFKILLQAAPFVFTDYMCSETKPIWFALCKLTPFIFQTTINNMKTFLVNLKAHVNEFLYHLIKSNAQWVNKPKFHMLLHLPESIERFGPAPGFSTEKFEPFNGVLRKASVHSNKLAPGRDIATTFENLSSLRLVMSDGVILDDITGMTRKIGPEVTSFFRNNVSVQRSMGYNADLARSPDARKFPSRTMLPLPEDLQCAIPDSLQNAHGTSGISQVAQVLINKHDRVNHGSFVAVTPRGRVATFFAEISVFTMGDVDAHYHMRQVVRSQHRVVVNAKYIQGCINVQHNCHLGECTVERTKAVLMEGKASRVKTGQVAHTDTDNYIINAASLHDPHLHQTVANLPILTPNGSDWSEAISRGLAIWTDGCEPVESDGEPASDGSNSEADADAEGITDSDESDEEQSSSDSEGSDSDGSDMGDEGGSESSNEDEGQSASEGHKTSTPH